MRIRFKIFFFCMIVMAASGRAESNIPGAFADIGYGARAMGMGGAYTALASDALAVIWNPAGLPYVRGTQISTMFTKQFALVPYTMVCAAKDFGAQHGVGAAFLTSGDEAWRETTFMAGWGMRLGSVSPSLESLAVGATLKIRTVSYGNNADGGPDRMRGSASGYGVDLGLRYKMAPKWTLGLLWRDAVNHLAYDNQTRGVRYTENVPAGFLFGAALLAKPNLVFAFDWDKSLHADQHDKFAVGGEWKLFDLLFLRAGWSQSIDIDVNGMFNLGAGIQYFTRQFGVRFDYAYQSYFLADTPRVSVTVWF
jgi:hypothetical protein